MNQNTRILSFIFSLSLLFASCTTNNHYLVADKYGRTVANVSTSSPDKSSFCVDVLAQLVSRKKFKNVGDSSDALVKIANDISLKTRMDAIGYNDPAEVRIQDGLEKALKSIKKKNKTITDELINEVKSGILSTNKLVKEWSDLESNVRWKLWQENPDFYRNIEVLKVMETPEVNPIEIYSVEGYKAWKKADDYLDGIRVGQFKLDREVAAQTNKLVVGADKQWSKVLNNIIPKKWWWKGGGEIRNRQVRGTPDIVTEAIFQKLIKNDFLGKPGFVEIPYRGKGKLCEGCRHGYIKYLEADEIDSRLNDLFTWVNNEIEKIKNNSTDAMDPIDLASQLQYNYVSIHPMLDGNGRTSKLLMDRVLKEFNLPPPMMLEDDWDIFYTKTEYAAKIRQGVLRSIELHKLALKEKSSGKWLGEAPTPFKVNKKDTPITRIGKTPISKELDKYKTWIKPNTRINYKSIELYLGGKRYVLQGDGFLYSPRGIPHVYNHQDKNVYPISQKAYDLYTEMGDFNPNLQLRRDINPAHKEVYANHLRMIRDLEEGKLSAEKIDNISYDVINKANKSNELFLHAWQESLFENAVKIDISLEDITSAATKEQRKTNSFATLSTQRGGLTNFERYWVKGSKIETGDVIAQYEWMDFQYWEYLQYAKKTGRKDLQKTISESRTKLHAAGRELLSDYFEEMNNLTSSQKKILEKDPDYILFNTYLKYSNLNKKSTKGLYSSRNDNKQILLRADYNWARAIGFVDETTYKRFLSSGGDKFINHLRKTHANWSDLKKAYLKKNGQKYMGERQLKRVSMKEVLESNPQLLKEHTKLAKSLKWLNTDYMLANVIELLESPYTHRGVSDEYESIFVNMILHMTDYRSNKLGASFSTNPRLYVKKGDTQTDFPFVQDSALLKTRLHVVTVPKKYLIRNRYNTYLGQNEFVSAHQRLKGLLSFNIIKGVSNFLNFKKSFDRGFLAKPVSDGTEEGNRALKDAKQAKGRLFDIDTPDAGSISDPNVE